MNKFLKNLLLLFVAIFAFGSAYAQSVSLDALRKDYPLLTERYGDRLKSRNAHYIFAIDISSSMLQYENVVRESLCKFLDAVPNGDQITIVVMSDENTTNYLDAAKCINLNDDLRQDIKTTIKSNNFVFRKEKDPMDGSDGFTMAKKVLEAMNVVNSSELTFVYMLTDFEYWTHKNEYDKNREDWASLKSLLTDKHKGMLCKYGIELTFKKPKHPEAIFKSDMDNIFGPLDYQPAASAAMLEQWFGHIINDIQAHKINAMLKADWKEYLGNCHPTLSNDGRELMIILDAPESDLVNGATVTLTNGGNPMLTPAKDVTATPNGKKGWKADIGHYNSERTALPSLLNVDSAETSVTVRYESPYAEEIKKLQGLCQEKPSTPDAVCLDQSYSLTAPATKLWNAKLHWWFYALILLIILGIIASIVYTMLQHPERRNTSVVVKRRAGGVSKQYTGDTNRLPLTIGDGADVNIPGASWTLKITAKRYNPIITWFTLGKCKTGYYAILEAGDYAELINDYTDEQCGTIGTTKYVLLFPYKKAPKKRIEINEGTTTNRIEIG